MPRTFWILAPVAALTIAVGAMLLMGGGTTGPSPTPTSLPTPPLGTTSSPSASAYPLAPGEAWILIGGDNLATLIRPDGSGRHEILVRIGTTVLDPAWSPDGELIAFDGNGDSGTHLWLASADGTDAHQLVPTPEGCPGGLCVESTNPAWSPDGRSIAYIALEHDGGVFTKASLFVLDVANGTTTDVYSTTEAMLVRPTWSPDGRSIAFEVQRFVGAVEGSLKDTAIGVVDLDAADQAPNMITSPDLLAGYPVWHPESDLIVFRTNPVNNDTGRVLDESAASDIYTINADGTNLTRVTQNAVGGRIVRAPSWTPDGRILFTALAGPGSPELMRLMDADGKNEESATGAVDTEGQGRWRPGT